MNISHRMRVSPQEYRAALSAVSDNSIFSPVARRVEWLEELLPKLIARIENAEDAEGVVLYHIAKEALEWPHSQPSKEAKP